MSTHLIDVTVPKFTLEEIKQMNFVTEQKYLPIVSSLLDSFKKPHNKSLKEPYNVVYSSGDQKIDEVIIPLFKGIGIALKPHYIEMGYNPQLTRMGYELEESKKNLDAQFSFQKYRESGNYADFTIFFDDKESIKVHRIILARYSLTLEALFNTAMLEKVEERCCFTTASLTTSGTNSASIKNAIDFCYQSSVDLTRLTIQEIGFLYGAAQFLQIADLRQLCMHELLERLVKPLLQEYVVAEIADIANFFEISSLKTICQLLLKNSV